MFIFQPLRKRPSLLAFLLTASPLAAQSIADLPAIRVTTRLVDVRLIEADNKGPFSGVTARDFKTLDNKAILTVAVYDYAGLPSGVLEGTVDTARVAMNGAGIVTAWSVCHVANDILECTESSEPSSGRQVDVLIMAEAVSLPAGPSAYGDLGGFAITGDAALAEPRAWVFYSAAQELARATDRSSALVLGSILIHEMGHVLGLEHQNDGVMRANPTAAGLDELSMGRGFSPAEVEQLREGVARLNAAASQTR